MSTVKNVKLEQFLTYVSAICRETEGGYLSRKVATEKGSESTSELAWSWATEGRKGSVSMMKIDNFDRHVANKIVSWLCSLKNDRKLMNSGNEYMLNLMLLGSRKDLCIDQRYSGYAASAISVWEKSTGNGDGTGRGIKIRPTEFLGNVGEKICATGTYLVDTHIFNSSYGLCYVHKFRTSDGNIFSWSTSKDDLLLGLIAGQTYTVTGTVKKHSVYGTIRSTDLTRCKLVRIVAD